VIVDAVEEVLTIDDELVAVPGADTALIDSIAEINGRLVALVDPSTIFPAAPSTRG
jgi:chemotaxis signal transduction protein